MPSSISRAEGADPPLKAGRAQNSRLSSPTTSGCGKLPHPPHAEQHARHERLAADRVVADAQRLTDVAEQHLLVGDQAGQAHRVDRRRRRRRSPRPSAAAVRAAVPLGASSLASWCSSMISAFAMCLAASAAKRIISTAPIAKFGATSTFARGPSPSRAASAAARSACRSKPVVPTTACTPARRHASAFCERRVRAREVDDHVGVAAARRPARPPAAGRRGRSAACPLRPRRRRIRSGPYARRRRRRPRRSSRGPVGRDRARRCGRAGRVAERCDRPLERRLVGPDAGDRQRRRREQLARPARAGRRSARRRSARSPRRSRGSACRAAASRRGGSCARRSTPSPARRGP